MPQLQDPNFARTVVLLCEHGENGAFGLVINRPTDTSAAEAVQLTPPPVRDAGVQLWQGGPVEPQRGWILLGERPDGGESVELSDGLVPLDLARRVADHRRRGLAAHAHPDGLRGMGTGPARRGVRRIRLADGRHRSRSWCSTRRPTRCGKPPSGSSAPTPACCRWGTASTDTNTHCRPAGGDRGRSRRLFHGRAATLFAESAARTDLRDPGPRAGTHCQAAGRNGRLGLGKERSAPASPHDSCLRRPTGRTVPRVWSRRGPGRTPGRRTGAGCHSRVPPRCHRARQGVVREPGPRARPSLRGRGGRPRDRATSRFVRSRRGANG